MIRAHLMCLMITIMNKQSMKLNQIKLHTGFNKYQYNQEIVIWNNQLVLKIEETVQTIVRGMQPNSFISQFILLQSRVLHRFRLNCKIIIIQLLLEKQLQMDRINLNNRIKLICRKIISLIIISKITRIMVTNKYK
jgi:hypothetical protein